MSSGCFPLTHEALKHKASIPVRAGPWLLLAVLAGLDLALPARLCPTVSGEPGGHESAVDWEALSGDWNPGETRIEGESIEQGYCVAAASRYASEQTLEVTCVPRRRIAPEGAWTAAGLCLFQDMKNFWRLALVESPTGEHHAELVEMYEGDWQAQGAGKTALRSLGAEGMGLDWKFGSRYRLRLTLTPAEIQGEVLGEDGGSLCRVRYGLGATPALRCGWLTVNVQGMRADYEGCVQREGVGPPPRMQGCPIELVRDPAMGGDVVAGILDEAFRSAGVEVSTATLSDLVREAWWKERAGGMVALPNARRVPAAARKFLLDFLRRGGRLVCVGAPLWAEPLFPSSKGWTDEKGLGGRGDATETLMRRAGGPQEETARWERLSNRPSAASRLVMERSEKGPAIKLEIRDLEGWDNFARSFQDSPFPTEHRLTCFWARSEREEDSLAVEWQEKDGSRWIATVAVSEAWQRYALKPSDFPAWRDGPAAERRGGPGDSFRPEEAARLILGFASSHRAGKGDHTVWIASLATAPDPSGVDEMPFDLPPIEGLYPAGTLHPVQSGLRLEAPESPFQAEGMAATHHDLGTVPPGCLSPVARPAGLGFKRRQAYRLLPLIRAVDESGNHRGTPAWLVLHFGWPYRGASWLGMGVTDGRFWLQNRVALSALIAGTVRWMADGVFLVQGGVDRFTAYEGEQVTLGASLVNLSRQQAAVRLHANLVRAPAQRGRPPDFQGSREMALGAFQVRTVHWQPDALTPGTYDVEVRLDGRPKGHSDAMRHTVEVTGRPVVNEEDAVSVRGGHFWLKGKRWFALGVNFWPRYVAGLSPEAFRRHWLSPEFYDPVAVERDLEQVAALGMNCVSIQYGSAEQAMPLRDFLRRCHNKKLKVNLFLEGAHPLQMQPETVRRLVEAASLGDQPALFAYDVAWEPVWGKAADRQRFDEEWKAWLLHRRGSVEQAEADWGLKANRDAKGQVTGPTDEQVAQDGPWRPLVADYRRFQDDLLSERYRRVRELIRSLDRHHLMGARTGWGGGPFIPGPVMAFDHSSGVESLDFVSPEGWNLQGEWKDFERGAFIAAYDRMVSGGKPVFWAEFGLDVGWPLAGLTGGEGSVKEAQAALRRQDQHYENFFRMALLSHADGAMAWWFPGGYRAGERSDFGIVNPDGSPRPVCEVIRRFAQQVAELPPAPAPQVWVTVDRFGDARGPWALEQKRADEFLKLLRQGKAVGLKE